MIGKKSRRGHSGGKAGVPAAHTTPFTQHPPHTHVITLTPTPDTLVGSACDPETLACSGRRAVIDAY